MIQGRLAKKKVLITGAGQGIGRAAAKLFANEGASVYATDVNRDALATLRVEQASIETRVLDVRDATAIQQLADELGLFDVLFNCAGYVHQGTIRECSVEDWSRSFDINVNSMFYMCRAFLPEMQRAKQGVIINMASAVSSIKGAPNRFAYGASKGAVIGLTKAIAADFVGTGIRCNALCPGTVETPSLNERISLFADEAAARAAFVARQPMGRFGRPDEIAAASLFLASDESSYMTGQCLIVDGGMTL